MLGLRFSQIDPQLTKRVVPQGLSAQGGVTAAPRFNRANAYFLLQHGSGCDPYSFAIANYLLNCLHHRESKILLLITKLFQLAEICLVAL
jgi:hypothetical protein